jgi:hypothetical protein
VDDNFSETSWENYRNNFFATMIPREREYSTFGLATVVESPRFGPATVRSEMSAANARNEMTSANGVSAMSAANARNEMSGASARGDQPKSRRSSSYSQVVADGPPKKEELREEVAVLVIPVSPHERAAREKIQARSRSHSHVSISEHVDMIPPSAIYKDEPHEKTYVTTTAYTIGKFELFDGEEYVDPEEEQIRAEQYERALRDVKVERVVFPGEGAGAGTEPEPSPMKENLKKEEPAHTLMHEPAHKPPPVAKYIPPWERKKEATGPGPGPGPQPQPVQTEKPPASGDPAHVYTVGQMPHIQEIHYSDNPGVNPTVNSLGESRLLEFDFVINDSIQYIEGKMFYFPKQVVKLQCAPYVHVNDTDFMKEDDGGS